MNDFSQNLECIKAQNEIQLGNISENSQKHISECETCSDLTLKLSSAQTLNKLFDERETAPAWDSFAQKMGFEDSVKAEESEQDNFQFLNGLFPRFAIGLTVFLLIVSGGIMQQKFGSNKLLKGENLFLKATANNYQKFVKKVRAEKLFNRLNQ